MKKGIVTIALGFFMGVLLFSLVAAKQKNFKASDLGLGLNTVSRKAFYDGRQISQIRGVEQIKETIKYFHQKDQKIAIWLGASQLHAINHFKKGDKLAVEVANINSEDKKEELLYVQVSTPNASFHDLLGYYLMFRESEAIPDILIVAVVFDDLAEINIQQKILSELPEINKSLITLGSFCTEIPKRNS